MSYEALRTNAAWVDLSDRGKIKVSGEDRIRLVHAMCTNNVQELTEGQGLYTFFLNAQGRVLADASIFALQDSLLLDTEPAARQKLYDHLDKFIIADDVTLEDATGSLATIGVEGPKAEDILREIGAPVAAEQHGVQVWNGGYVARLSDTGGVGFAFYVPIKASLIEKLKNAGVPEATAAEAQIVRTENRRPRFGMDFGENLIAHETGLMEALHFSKGCYLGQEIVERVRSRGHLNKRLYAIDIEAQTPPSTGAKLQAGGKEAGEVTSAAFSPAASKVLGFGIIRTEALTKPLSLEGAAVTVPALAVSTKEC